MTGESMREYLRATEVLRSGGAADLDALAREIDGFPDGLDRYLGSRWILLAIAVGSTASVRWMVDRGVALDFLGPDGYTPVHSALERARDDRLELLDLLLRAGAPVNTKGVNDWTPAHKAAAADDVAALRVLVAHGADLSIRTAIDDFATPLEEARILGKLAAVEYLESLG
jgi:ankyrin repeat protein